MAKIEINGQREYELWLASSPDFSQITVFRADNRITNLRA